MSTARVEPQQARHFLLQSVERLTLLRPGSRGIRRALFPAVLTLPKGGCYASQSDGADAMAESPMLAAESHSKSLRRCGRIR